MSKIKCDRFVTPRIDHRSVHFFALKKELKVK